MWENMTLDDYAEFGLYDVGVQLVRLQSCLNKLGISTKLEVENLALLVYACSENMLHNSPIFEIYVDIQTYNVAVLNIKTCGNYSIHPYLSWLWVNLSPEVKASMMKSMLEDPDNGPKKRIVKIPT